MFTWYVAEIISTLGCDLKGEATSREYLNEEVAVQPRSGESETNVFCFRQ